MHSYNLGLFSIGELKTYTMKPELSYERITLPPKDCKYHNIKSKVYRRWVRKQISKSNTKCYKIRRNNQRYNIMGSSLTYVRKHHKRNIQEEKDMFIKLTKQKNERKIQRRSRQIKYQIRMRSNC